MSEKLANKNKRKEGLTWGSPLCSPAAAGRPSQQAAQPTWPPSSVVFLPDRGTERARRARARHRATPPACLPACPASATPRCFFSVPPRSPGLTPLSPVLFPFSLALSLSRVRTRRSPPFAIAAATGLPSPPRHAQELRPLALKLLVEPRTSGRLVEPPPSSFPSPAAVDPHQRSGRFSASPSPLRPSLQPR